MGDIMINPKYILYLKIELSNEKDYLKVAPILSPKKRLKIGTFKIKMIKESTGWKDGIMICDRSGCFCWHILFG